MNIFQYIKVLILLDVCKKKNKCVCVSSINFQCTEWSNYQAKIIKFRMLKFYFEIVNNIDEYICLSIELLYEKRIVFFK